MIRLELEQAFDKAMAHLAAGDLQKARRRMKAAADASYLPAVTLYASFVEHGIGGRASEHRAMPWYEKAAGLGDVSAKIRLGRWHLAHNRLPQAKYWLRQAHNGRARLVLAGLYEASRSVRANARAAQALSAVVTAQYQLDDDERAEYGRLRAECSKRTAHPFWSRMQQKMLERQWERFSASEDTISFNADALRPWLIDHHIKVEPPAVPSAINGLRKAMWGAVHPDLIAMYNAFDGTGKLPLGPDHSFTIWPIQSGLAYMRDRGISGKFPLGELDDERDVLLCSTTLPEVPVQWERGRMPGRCSLWQFINSLMGHRDWQETVPVPGTGWRL